MTHRRHGNISAAATSIMLWTIRPSQKARAKGIMEREEGEENVERREGARLVEC